MSGLIMQRRSWLGYSMRVLGAHFRPRHARVRSGMATINDARLREILTGSPTVAVLGIHHEPEKAAYYVPEYLHDEGYRVIGVNPELTTQTLFGERVRATLREIDEPIDLIDVFRR